VANWLQGLQVPDRGQDPVGIVIEIANALVALVAEKPPNTAPARLAARAAGSIVINSKPLASRINFSADCTLAALKPKHLLVLLDGHVEYGLEVILLPVVLHGSPLGLPSLG